MSLAEKRKRKERRIRFRVNIQYEKVLNDGSFAIPVGTVARNITVRGIGFYSIEKLELNSKLRVKFFMAEGEEISYIGRVRRMEISEDAKKEYIVGVEVENISDDDKNRLSQFIKKIDVFRVLDSIKLENVVDIHFVVGYPPVIKKIGKLEISKGESFTEGVLAALLLDSLDKERYEEFIREKEINFVFADYKKARFRVNLHIQQGKVEGVFRLIPSQIPLPSQLGLSSEVEKVLDSKNGLILVAGRTGSGKTTTIASMVEFLNATRQGIVVCIENPVEYLHANKKCIIKQREVGKDTISFRNATKNALRQNPDILIIGEILDREVMEIALTAAESGALVLTTIHAADSSQALDRITSLFPADMQQHALSRLSLVLRMLLTQELIPQLNGEKLALASEILIVNAALKNVIRGGNWTQIPTIIQTGKATGMRSMKESLNRLCRVGLIDVGYLKDYIE